MRDIGSNLTNKQLIKDMDSILDKSIESGITHIDITGTSLIGSKEAKGLAHKYDSEKLKLTFTAGVHPHNADSFILNEKENITILSNLLIDSKCSMVGELGLDYSRMYSKKENQIKAFEIQLDNANQFLNKPLFLHNREAFQDFMDIIKNSQSKNTRIIHCFTGTKEEAKVLLENNFYFGITGWVCDTKRNQDLIKALEIIPVDKLLIETDAPYLIPLNLKGSERRSTNYPYYLKYVIEKIAEVKKIDINSLKDEIIKNEQIIFNTDYPKIKTSNFSI